MDQPAISITQLDHDRLENLLDARELLNTPGLEALREELARANIVEPEAIPANTVTMNSTIRFVNDTTGNESELTLVYPHSAGKAGTVSILAPVGSALLGLSVGQKIAWQTPGGKTLQLRVIEVISQPEAEGNFDL